MEAAGRILGHKMWRVSPQLLPVKVAFPLELKIGAGASAPAQPPSPDALGQKRSSGVWLI